MDFPTNPVLPPDVLARAAALPTKPTPVNLVGQFVYLKPLNLARDVEALYALSNGAAAQVGERRIEAYDPDTLIWRYMSGGPFADTAALGAWLQGQSDNPSGLPLTVFDAASDTPVGVANIMSNVPAHLTIELGNIWYSPVVQRTPVNSEATYLMLRHVFLLGYRRVVWKCDALNARSRRAAERLGFAFEGIHDSHYIIKGRNRDTAWFRILDGEWDAVRARLEARLYGGA